MPVETEITPENVKDQSDASAPSTPAAEAPVRPQNAQMAQKICFWFNPRTNHILTGAPEHFPVLIPGYERIVCNHALEAERWSKRLADQTRREIEATEEERDAFDSVMRADLRSCLQKALLQTSSEAGAILLKRELERLDRMERTSRTKHESYLHVEAFEKGK